MHYLDNSATTPVLPEAAEAALRVMREDFGNPSSQHTLGIHAAGLLKASRASVARALGAQPGEIIFTSGGTESINTAIFGVCRKHFRRGRHIITTAAEHSATLASLKKLEGEGFAVTDLQPDATGHISLDDFENALREDTILLTVLLVNNEVGTRMPVAEMGRRLKRKCPQALFHIDAVQGLFRVPLTPARWGCDLMSVSGHKIGAPKGIGALYVKSGVRLPPLLYGGGQENGFRPGTEPMPNIAAFAAACDRRAQTFDEDTAHVQALAAYLREQVAAQLPWAVQNGENDVPHVVNLSLPGCKSEVMLRVLEQDGVYVSAGSACAKGHESHVLRAMGLPKERIDSALRVSFAPFNTKEDVDALLAALKKGAAMLRR
ncbi:MAG: cysteine desulfurase family protein [Intestinibacillus sp.]